MKIKNYKKMLAMFKEDDKILDIGGWEKPFNRATHVLDILPYRTRKKQNSFPKGIKERFKKETWILHDIKDPLPFKNNEFDFVVCGHVLEDIKDPVFLAKEIMRISKAGYFEFPNRAFEMKNNVDPFLNSDRYVGFCHHRWLITVLRNKITFVPKTSIHSAYKELRCNKINEKYTGFFWKDSFKIKEVFFKSQKEMLEEATLFKIKNDVLSKKKIEIYFKLNKLFAYLRYLLSPRIILSRYYNSLIKE